MARFVLWVAALSLVCLGGVVAQDTVPQTTASENVCAQFFTDGPTMTIARVFDMIELNLKQYAPNFGTEQMRSFMTYADSDRDNLLNQAECENLVVYIKNLNPTL